MEYEVEFERVKGYEQEKSEAECVWCGSRLFVPRKESEQGSADDAFVDALRRSYCALHTAPDEQFGQILNL